jgi:hypothetical protein
MSLVRTLLLINETSLARERERDKVSSEYRLSPFSMKFSSRDFSRLV